MLLFQTLQLFSDPIARGGPAQMALDEALLESATRPVLRVYRWAGPAASFGYSQSLAAVERSHPSLPLVRRWTGGGIVEHGSDRTFSLVVPSVDPLAKLRPAETYRLIHKLLTAVPAAGARLVRAEECARGEACFDAPALHDVMAGDGRKVCGGAQRRTRRGLLHQGSIQGCEVSASRLAEIFATRVEPWPGGDSLEHRVRDLVSEKYDTPGWRAKIP